MWIDFTVEKARADLPGLLAESEKAVSAIENANPADYEGLVWALDDATRGLWRVWGRVTHMLGVMNSPEWRWLEEEWQPKLVEFSLRVGQSKPVYEAARRVLSSSDTRRSSLRVRIVSKMIESAEHAGVGLEDGKRERFNAIQARLAQLSADFSNAVIDATAAFKYEKDGKVYTIDDANYVETMKHCPDREVREALCRARATRAPENEARIGEILALRGELAALLGYRDYAALSLATKCAPSVAAVMKMIDDLDLATAAASEKEDRELEEENGGPLAPWDTAYCSERLREKRYSYSEEELKRCFEFADVLKGLFRMTEFLFGVTVEESENADVWHKDVRYFTVKENGEPIANFYLDPFVRPGQKQNGAWMNEFRNRSDRLGETPVAVLVLNLKRPDGEGRTYLPMREVETVFHEFGHALQCMLTRIGEEDAAGINLVEWDAVEIASQFMENWCLDDRTGIVVPEVLKAKVRAAKNFRAASACRRQLAFSKTDIELHLPGDRAELPGEVKNRNFAHFGVKTVDADRFLCAFTHIFAGGYAAGYYGYKWAEVMSADCYGAFEEAGLGDDNAMRRLGSKYRETVLALGGSKSALEVFRDFRGRDPEIGAMLRQQGLSR